MQAKKVRYGDMEVDELIEARSRFLIVYMESPDPHDIIDAKFELAKIKHYLFLKTNDPKYI